MSHQKRWEKVTAAKAFPFPGCLSGWKAQSCCCVDTAEHPLLYNRLKMQLKEIDILLRWEEKNVEENICGGRFIPVQLPRSFTLNLTWYVFPHATLQQWSSGALSWTFGSTAISSTYSFHLSYFLRHFSLCRIAQQKTHRNLNLTEHHWITHSGAELHKESRPCEAPITRGHPMFPKRTAQSLKHLGFRCTCLLSPN